jgi:hypothetical protein
MKQTTSHRLQDWKTGAWITLAMSVVLFCAQGALSEEWRFSEGKPTSWRVSNAQASKAVGGGLQLQTTHVDMQLSLDIGRHVFPAGTAVTVEMATTTKGMVQLFWGGSFNEQDSLRLPLQSNGKTHAYRFAFPQKTPVTQLRLDPVNGPGAVVIHRIAFQNPRPVLVGPVPPGPYAPAAKKTVEVTGDSLRLVLVTGKWNTFDLHVKNEDGKWIPAGTSMPNDRIILGNDTALDPAAGTVAWNNDTYTQILTVKDSDGVAWTVSARYDATAVPGCIRITQRVEVAAPRRVTRIPVAGLCAGNGSFGEKKNQALFPGLEYLADEPSSSKKDIRDSRSVRRVPDPMKITIPLMVVQAKGIYAGLAWGPECTMAAYFDSPARTLRGAGHAMALSLPPVGADLAENELVAHGAIPLEPGTPVTSEALIIGGAGEDVTAALQHYCSAVAPLPDLPDRSKDHAAQLRLFVDGYTRSDAWQDGLVRHAVWGKRFPAKKAADAAMFLKWIESECNDAVLAKRCDDAARRALARIDDGNYLGHKVSHIVPPAAPLLFGRLDDSLAALRSGSLKAIGSMNADGTYTYDGDLAKTHFEHQAVGYAAEKVRGILSAAALLGDDDILRAGLRGLDAMARFDGKVPRGAQTWEIPLHTPDIMGAGRAVEAFVLGYELTGNEEYLARAKHWAWTGVPFVYLRDPAPGEPAGRYATIAVYGGTRWANPFWIGLPVQWCGLTYAWPLIRLAAHDPDGPWATLARGITVSATQQQWPDGDRVGLLPDFFHLRQQRSDGPAINPGTVLAPYISLFGTSPLYDFAREPATGTYVHAPARLRKVLGNERALGFSLEGVRWKFPYTVLVARISGVTGVSIDGETAQAVDDVDAAPAPAWRFDATHKRLVIKVSGNLEVKVTTR